MSCKKDILKNFVQYTGKHLSWRFFFNKASVLIQSIYGIKWTRKYLVPFCIIYSSSTQCINLLAEKCEANFCKFLVTSKEAIFKCFGKDIYIYIYTYTLYIYTYTCTYSKYLYLIVLFMVSHIIPTFSGKTLILFLMELNATLRKDNTWITVKFFFFI